MARSLTGARIGEVVSVTDGSHVWAAWRPLQPVLSAVCPGGCVCSCDAHRDSAPPDVAARAGEVLAGRRSRGVEVRETR
jgi:hypothetical protein